MSLEIQSGAKSEHITPPEKQRTQILNTMPGQNQRADVRRYFERFSENYKKGREAAIQRGRKMAEEDLTREKIRADQPETQEEVDFHHELKERYEVNAESEFESLWEFEENRRQYGKEGGWRDGYLTEVSPLDGQPVRHKMSLESYVFDKQVQRLEEVRQSMLVSRVHNHVEALYPEFAEPLDSEKLDEKTKQMVVGCREYFETNKEKIDAYLQANGEDKEKAKDALFQEFAKGVFSDRNLSDPAIKAEIELLFTGLLADYEEMQKAIFVLGKMNSEMVAMMGQEGITEEEWLERLSKKAKEEAEKIKQQDQAQQTATTGAGYGRGFTGGGWGQEVVLTVAEQIPADSKITFTQIRPGEFEVVFPGAEDKTTMQSTFFARSRVNEQTGERETEYVFRDPLLDSEVSSSDAGFMEKINGLYMEHAMAKIMEKRTDYRGPDINGQILRDRGMFQLAKALFAPVDVTRKPMNEEQARVFGRMLTLLVTNANNEAGTGDYGDLLPIVNRVGLINLILSDANKAQAIYGRLAVMSTNEISSLSLESFCKQMGVTKNSGNFSK